jgi:hypothetical protein
MMKADLGLPSTSKKALALLGSHPGIYACIIVAVALIAYAYHFRTYTIFACKADGYSTDQYVAYCNGAGFGDYEHGAFWYDLEPAAENSARDADVLVLGNSRLQVALSTAATAEWFSTASARYYLLGFSYNENLAFAEEVLRKMRPRARVYVIEVEDFFKRYETPPMRAILHDPQTRERYERKRRWQRVHEPICKALPALCGDGPVIFRSRENGAYTKKTDTPRPTPVSYDQAIGEDAVKAETAVALDFLARLPVPRECVILTMVPTVDTKIGNVSAIAKALGRNLLTPEMLAGLQTFDGSHLDRSSAERWSQAFFRAAGPRIRSCLERQRAAQPAAGSSR